MIRAVEIAVAPPASPTPPATTSTVGAEHLRQVEADLIATRERLSEATAELGTLRGQLTTQKGMIEKLRDEAEDARVREEAASAAIAAQVNDKRQGTPPPTVAPTLLEEQSKVIAELEENIKVLEDDLESCKAGRALEVMELRKALGAATNEAALLEEKWLESDFELKRVTATAQLVPGLKADLNLAADRADSAAELRAEQEAKWNEQDKKHRDTINGLSAEVAKMTAEIASLKEQLDAANVALEDAETLCKDALLFSR